MSARNTPTDRARIRADEITTRLASELREARLNLGLSQADAARRVGIDRAEWSRIERRERRSVPIDLAVRLAAAVNLDLVVKVYASDHEARDAAQIRLLQDLRHLLGPDWEWRYEVRVGPAPDQRSWDAVARHRVTGLTIRVEGETRLRDVQATLRKIEGKRTTDPGRVVLAVRSSRDNRETVHLAEDVLRSQFPADPRTALARLRAGEDPGADLLVMVDWLRHAGPASSSAVAA